MGLKNTFQRDYQQKWTEEVFCITKRLRQQGFNLYQLKDLLDEIANNNNKKRLNMVLQVRGAVSN